MLTPLTCHLVVQWIMALSIVMMPSASAAAQKPSLNILGFWWKMTHPYFGVLPMSIHYSVEHMTKYAVDQVNSNPDFGFTVNITWVREGGDTCDLGTAVEDFVTEVKGNKNKQYHGIIGPSECGDVCERTAEMAYDSNLVVVSYGCLADELSNEVKYPSFFRHVPPAQQQVKAWIGVMRYYEWRKVGMLTDPTLNVLVMMQRSFDSLAKQAGIDCESCLDVSMAPTDRTQIGRALDALEKRKVRILVLNQQFIGTLATYSVMYEKRFWSWDRVTFAHDAYIGKEINFLGWWSGIGPVGGWGVMSPANDLLEVMSNTFSTMPPVMSFHSPTLMSGASPQEVQKVRNKDTKFGGPSWLGSYAYDAVWIWALAMKEHLKSDPNYLTTFAYDNKTAMSEMRRHMKQISNVTGVTGPLEFDNAGNRISPIEINRVNLSTVKQMMWHRVGVYEKGQIKWEATIRWGNTTHTHTPGGNSTMTDLKLSGHVPLGGWPCLPGTFLVNPEQAAVQCRSCEAGRYSNKPGANMCTACGTGTYSDSKGSTACKSCPASFTTGLAAKDRRACICKKGMYLPCLGKNYNVSNCDVSLPFRAGRVCQNCPSDEAFSCQGDSARHPDIVGQMVHRQPTLNKRFYVKSSAPYAAFACKEAQDHCIGSGPGKCSGGRHGLQCSRCPSGEFSTKGGRCKDCSSGPMFLMPVLVLGMIVVLLAVYEAGGTKKSHSLAKTLLFSSFGLMVSNAQAFSILDTFQVAWPEILSTIFDVFRILDLDINVVAPTCFVGNDSLWALYGPRVSVLLSVVVMYVVLGLISKIFHFLAARVPNMEFDQCFNAVGVIVNALFVGVVKSVFEIFYCRENPSRTESLVKAPLTRTRYEGFLCNEDGMDDLLRALPLTVVFGLLYIATALAVYAYGLWYAPSKWHTDRSFRTRFRFLLSRWNPQWWYWGGFFMIRNLLLPMVTAITVNGLWQLSLFILIVGTLCILQVWCQPWRDPTGNLLDAGMSVALVCMNVFGIGMLPEARPEDVDIVGRISVASFFIGLFLLLSFVVVEIVPMARSLSSKVKLDALADDVKKAFLALRTENGTAERLSTDFVEQLSGQDIQRMRSLVDNLTEHFQGKASHPLQGIRPATILTSSPAKEQCAPSSQQEAEIV